MKHIHDIIAKVEVTLADVYGFDLNVRAFEHIIPKDQLSAALGPDVNNHAVFHSAGGLWVDESHDQVFIGLHFEDHIYQNLHSQNPLQQLSLDNIHAFCVLVEEVSHFHAYLNRLRLKQPISHLELEFQAEIDKLLMSEIILMQQTHRSHASQLAMLLYDQAKIYAQDANLYRLATHYAGRFWFEVLRQIPSPLTEPSTKKLLRKIYQGTWNEKKNFVETLGKTKARLAS